MKKVFACFAILLFLLSLVSATKEEMLACYNGGGLVKAYEEYVKAYNKLMSAMNEYEIDSDEFKEVWYEYVDIYIYYRDLKAGKISPDCSEYYWDTDDGDDEEVNIEEPWDELESQITIKEKILELMKNDKELKSKIYKDILGRMRGRGNKDEAIKELSEAKDELDQAEAEYIALLNEIKKDKLKVGKMQREIREEDLIEEIGEQQGIVDYFNNVFKPIYLENMPRWIFEKFTSYKSFLSEYHGENAPFQDKNSPDIVYGIGLGSCGDTADAIIEKGLENCDDFYPMPVTADAFNPPAELLRALHLPYEWISQNHIAVLNVPEDAVKQNVESQKAFLDEKIAILAGKVATYDADTDEGKRWRKSLTEYQLAKYKLDNFDEEYKRDPYSFIDPKNSALTFVVKPHLNDNVLQLGSMNDWTVVDPFNGKIFSWYDWSKKYDGIFEFHDQDNWELDDNRDPVFDYAYPGKGGEMQK